MIIAKKESQTKKKGKKIMLSEFSNESRMALVTDGDLPADWNRFQWFEVIIVLRGQNRFEKLIIVHVS